MKYIIFNTYGCKAGIFSGAGSIGMASCLHGPEIISGSEGNGINAVKDAFIMCYSPMHISTGNLNSFLELPDKTFRVKITITLLYILHLTFNIGPDQAIGSVV